MPANIVNWAGAETVAEEDWIAYLSELTGIEPKIEYTKTGTLESVMVDTTKLFSITGPFKTDWKDGMRRMVEARHSMPARCWAASVPPFGEKVLATQTSISVL